jgi:type II restriction enzyme
MVYEIVEKQPRLFHLKDVLRYADDLRAEYPANQFVEAKIRQSLQVLRDQGVLRFLGKGNYERLASEPVFTPIYDPSLASNYTNRAQIARVLIETWAELNLYCLNCARDALGRLPPNTPVADFICPACNATYQLKSKDGRFGDFLIGAAYEATLRAVHSGEMPAYVLVEYDRRRSTIVYADALPGELIDETRVIARRPLSSTARRAGWQGCTIDVSGLPSVAIVQPAGTNRVVARREWEMIPRGRDDQLSDVRLRIVEPPPAS